MSSSRAGLDFQGRTALVTGATRGIGRAIAELLSANGCQVLTTGTTRRTGEENYFAVDFSDLDALELFKKEIAQKKIDILVNNAGINQIDPFCKISTETFQKIHTVNTVAPFALCGAVLPHMREQKWGRIVNVSSIFSSITKEFRASYSASKFALVGMTKALAVEVASEGVLVNCIAPGFINTELTQKILGAEQMQALAGQVPMRRLGEPREVAELVAWLVSEKNTFLTGQNIPLDGGFTCV